MNRQAAAVAVLLLHVRNGGDEIADRAFPVLVEDTQAHQAAARRHPAGALQPRLLKLSIPVLLQIPGDGNRPICHRRVGRNPPLPGNDAGDVRAVAVLIVERSRAVEREVLVERRVGIDIGVFLEMLVILVDA